MNGLSTSRRERSIQFFFIASRLRTYLSWLSRSALAALLILGFTAGRATALTLEADSDIATAGFFQLTWTSEGPVELQESRQPDFSAARVIYAGADRARVISGKPDGDWYYRVRPAGNPVSAPWSEPIHVTVAHHSLGRALTFFAVGAIVFAATLGLIVRGSRQHA